MGCGQSSFHLRPRANCHRNTRHSLLLSERHDVRGAAFRQTARGSESVTYEGAGEQKKWLRLESYGPKFVENIVQATARDILAEAMLRLNAAGYRIVMHVHDEAVIEAPPDTSLENICSVMGQTPTWASGLLLRADGYVCDFYKKD